MDRLHESAQRLLEFREVEWLEKIVARPEPGGFQSVFKRAMRGDDQDGRGVGGLSNAGEHLQPIHVRKADVQHDEIIGVFCQLGDAALA